MHLPKGMPTASAPNALSGQNPKSGPLRLRAGGQEVAVVSRLAGGFATSAGGPRLRRGFVEIFEGRRLLRRGPACPVTEAVGQRIYAFKTMSAASLDQPADHVRRAPATALVPLRHRPA